MFSKYSTTSIGAALILMLTYTNNVSATTYNVTGLFSYYDPTSMIVGGYENQPLTGTYSDTTNFMSLDYVELLFGFTWHADGNIVTTPGIYDIDTIQGGTVTGINVGSGQWLGNLLFDWISTYDMDVIHVWDATYNPNGTISLISTDVISDLFPTGSGAPGHPTIDGPTDGFSYTFDLLLTPVPVPAAIWLFGSGLIGLIGMARRKR